MTETMYPKPSKALAERRRALAPEIDAAFHQLNEAVFRDGALPRKTALKEYLTRRVKRVAAHRR